MSILRAKLNTASAVILDCGRLGSGNFGEWARFGRTAFCSLFKIASRPLRKPLASTPPRILSLLFGAVQVPLLSCDAVFDRKFSFWDFPVVDIIWIGPTPTRVVSPDLFLVQREFDLTTREIAKSIVPS